MKHLKTFEGFLNKSSGILKRAGVKKALADANRIMDKEKGYEYDTLEDAALDMEQAIDAGVEDPEILKWLDKYGNH